MLVTHLQFRLRKEIMGGRVPLSQVVFGLVAVVVALVVLAPTEQIRP